MADYHLLVVQEAAKEHDSCTNNLYNGLKELGMELTEDPRYSPTPSKVLADVAGTHTHTLRCAGCIAEGVSWVALHQYHQDMLQRECMPQRPSCPCTPWLSCIALPGSKPAGCWVLHSLSRVSWDLCGSLSPRDSWKAVLA